MARKSIEIDNMFQISIGFDVSPKTTQAGLIPFVYDDSTGPKMPGQKRYVCTIYIPKPEQMQVERFMSDTAKEVDTDGSA